MKFCIHCGNQIKADSKFCSKCGNAQKVSTQTAISSTPTTNAPAPSSSKKTVVLVVALGALLIVGGGVYLLSTSGGTNAAPPLSPPPLASAPALTPATSTPTPASTPAVPAVTEVEQSDEETMHHNQPTTWRNVFADHLRNTAIHHDYDPGAVSIFANEEFAVLVAHTMGAQGLLYINGTVTEHNIGSTMFEYGHVLIQPEHRSLVSRPHTGGAEWFSLSFYRIEGNQFERAFGARGEGWVSFLTEEEYHVEFFQGMWPDETLLTFDRFVQLREPWASNDSVSPAQFSNAQDAIDALESEEVLVFSPASIQPHFDWIDFRYHDIIAIRQRATVGNFILPMSSTRYLTAADVAHLNSAQLRIARNEIYARHGRRFNAVDLQSHFDAQSWYHGTIAPANFSDSVFNSFEVANIAFIQARE